MAEKDIVTALKKKRTQLRTAVTKLVKTIDEEIEKDNVNYEKVEPEEADREFNSSEDYRDKEIHILVGVDIAGKLFTSKLVNLASGLTCLETLLGWTNLGKTDKTETSNSSLLVLSSHVNDVKILDLWTLDSIGIKEDNIKHNKSETRELALEHFRKMVCRDSTGRFKINLPWLHGHPPLQGNKTAVFEDNSTTKVRPVFDGSAKTKNSVSINDCLEKGPNLIEMIPAILNRVRWLKIGVISDIKQAFLQIALSEADRDVLRFIWWREGDPHNMVYYRHGRVVFGISCRPFLLAAVLNYVLDQAEELEKDTWNIFVGNRVREIQLLSDPENWNFLPGIRNPADLLLRGCNTKELAKYHWWEGLQWLRDPTGE
ncbi:integrase catalytic domain-containing protein [Trichonephila clavipes]|nr:integrase catalytic domain-containing protein [Trichonephila clavipes]